MRAGLHFPQVALAILTAHAVTSVSFAGEVSFDFSMEQSAFEMTTFGGGDVIFWPGGTSCFEEGLPDLPSIARTFVIPCGTTAFDAEVEILSSARLDGMYDILPVRSVPLNSVPGPLLRNPSVYSTSSDFPASPLISVQNGTRTGFRLATVQFTPFSYNPVSGSLTCVTEARVTLRWSDDPSVPVLALTDAQIDNASGILANIVANPQDLTARRPSVQDNGPGTDWSSWVVISSSIHQSALQPLVDHRNATGLTAEFVSTEWIYANYTGYDTQEQIRNYIKDAYQNHGLMYVLIVGDWGETQRISSLNVGGSTTLNETSDLYYSDMDGTWDLDGDHLYGENSDGINYYSDVAVGRFSTNLTNLVQNMVDKTIEYETISPAGSWRTRALLCGAGLWPEYGYWGRFVCDSICERIPSSWVETKLYEYASGSHPTNQIDVINEGVSYVSPQGHGFSSGIYWYYAPTSMITAGLINGMTNWGMFPVFHSIACLAGQLSVTNCCAERLMNSTTGGAVAVMFNSNNGYGAPPSMGPSEHLEVHFANQMFVYGIQRVGDMQAAAKDAFKAAGGMSMQNWVIQENNMLGDPALLFITNQTGIEGGSGSVAAGPVLSGASPNPANGSFSVSWTLPTAGPATLSIYDTAGRLVRSAVPDPSALSGTMSFDGTDSSGSPLAAGCYLLRLDSSSGSAVSSMVYIGR